MVGAGLLKSFIVTFKHMFKKKVTVQYPEVEKPFSKRYRGRHYLEKEYCVACKLCQTHCPDTENVIKIETAEDPVTLRMVPVKFEIDLNVCCFCGICTEVCPTNCIQMTATGDMSQYDKNGAVIDLLDISATPPEKIHKESIHHGRIREVVDVERGKNQTRLEKLTKKEKVEEFVNTQVAKPNNWMVYGMASLFKGDLEKGEKDLLKAIEVLEESVAPASVKENKHEK